jgi:hypothetical protein
MINFFNNPRLILLWHLSNDFECENDSIILNTAKTLKQLENKWAGLHNLILVIFVIELYYAFLTKYDKLHISFQRL